MLIKNYIVFDIETTDLTALYNGGRVTCICAKTSCGKTFMSSCENEGEMLLMFVEWLYNFDPARYWLVTHNGKSFDAQYLYIRLAETTGRISHFDHLKRYRHFDTFAEYRDRTGKWISLNRLAAMLGVSCQKCGDGLQAIRWWKEGDVDSLVKYCMQDVEVTEKTFLAYQQKFGSGAK